MSEPKHTAGEWIYSTFTKPDGSPIQTVEDVAETIAFSVREGDRAELFGVSVDDKDDTGRHLIVCYTGNGPMSDANAEFITLACNAHYDLLAALKNARQFISNGIEFGYIDPLTPGSPEYSTLPAIEAAIAKAEGGGPC